MTTYNGGSRWLGQVQATELALTDNSSPTKGLTFADASRQATAGIASSEAQYYLQTIAIPFDYGDFGFGTPVEHIGFTTGTGDTNPVAKAYYLDGASWTSLALDVALTSGRGLVVNTLWGYTSSELWAVITSYEYPANGLVYKRTSGVWGAVSTPGGVSVNYTGKQAYNQSLHGSSASNVWCAGNAAGGTNAILKYNGSSLVAAGDSNITGKISCVHVISATDVWASEVDSATVYHYNGSVWTAYTDMVESGAVVTGISAASASAVFFVVKRNSSWTKCFQWDGAALNDITPASWEDPARANFIGVKAFASNDVWVCGNSNNYSFRYARWNGSAWTNYVYPTDFTFDGNFVLYGISGISSSDLVVSAYDPYTYGSYRWNGSAWASRPLPATLESPTSNRLPTVKLNGPALGALTSTTAIPTGARAMRYHVIVDVPFVGSSPDLEVSVGGTQLFAPGSCNLGAAKHYDGVEPKNISSGAVVTVTPTGTASAGSGIVLVEYQMPRS